MHYKHTIINGYNYLILLLVCVWYYRASVYVYDNVEKYEFLAHTITNTIHINLWYIVYKTVSVQSLEMSYRLKLSENYLESVKVYETYCWAYSEEAEENGKPLHNFSRCNTFITNIGDAWICELTKEFICLNCICKAHAQNDLLFVYYRCNKHV